MCSEVRVDKRNKGDLLLSFLLSHFCYGWFWFGFREGMLGAYCWLWWLLLAGGWATFLGSPQTGLKSWLGWHILEQCGPNLGTWSTGGNWDPSYLKCLPGYLWTLGHSVPGLDLWSPCHDWQIHCGLRWSVPGQFNHCGSWGIQEYCCPSVLSHGLSVWGYLEYWWGCCPVLLWSGQPSTWLSDDLTL